MRGRNKLLGILGIVLLCATSALAFDGGGAAGGGSFNAASPGAIGGTTSNTVQATNIAVGASAPTLDGQTGDITMSGGFATGGNVISGAAGNGDAVVSRSSGGAGVLVVGGTYASPDAQVNGLSNNIILKVGGTSVLSGTATSVSIPGGFALQSTGGAAPTCSSGSGTCTISTGSTNNRGQMVLAGGTTVTSLTLTFSAAGTWGQAPFCNFTSSTGSIGSPASGPCASTSACIATIPSSSAIQVNYICM